MKVTIGDNLKLCTLNKDEEWCNWYDGADGFRGFTPVVKTCQTIMSDLPEAYTNTAMNTHCIYVWMETEP
jgi:hypothetical protein